MALTPEQHAQIAVTYDGAASDESLPASVRQAFANKANWFRMVAKVAAKKQEAEATESPPKKLPWKASA